MGECSTRLECRPGGIRKHADAVGQADDPDRAGDYLRLGVVDLVRHRSFHGCAQHRAVEHVRYLDVDGIARAAIDLARDIDARHVLADEPEFAGLLQRLGLDLRRLVRDFGKSGDIAIAELAAGLGMHDHARLGGQLFGRNAELLGGVVDEHAAHLCAKHA